MPFIHVTTNLSVSDGAGEMLKNQLGHAIAVIPGKNEDWLMVQLEDEARLWFAGSDAPAAMVRVDLFGGARADACDELTGRVTEILESVLDVEPQRVYVRYTETQDWGWNGRNF